MIHVAYAIHDKDGRYSKFTATSMLSLFENVSYPPPSVTVHILHDNTLSLENRDKFNLIAGRYGQIVKFYNVDILCPEKITELKNLMPSIINSKFSVASLYRLLIPFVVPKNLDKIIYLDSDTVVNLDIKDLYQAELEGKALAVVPSVKNGVGENVAKRQMIIDGVVKYEDYFNAGVLVMNLEILRNAEKIISEGVLYIVKHPQYGVSDQEILNVCFAKNSLHLPLTFNCNVYKQRETLQPVDKRIYHYLMGPEGLGVQLNGADVFNKLWFKYFALTPFFNIETIGNLYKGVQQLYTEQKNFARQVSAIVSEKARAFFVTSKNLEAMKTLFSVKPNEEIILADSADSVRTLINSMKNSAGKKIFFIVSDDFLATYQILTRAGFIFGEDFLNAFEFLSDAEGLPLNSYPLVKLL